MWVFTAGVVATLVALSPLLITGFDPPPALWWLSMLMGVGLGMVLWGFLRAARQRGKQTRSALQSETG